MSRNCPPRRSSRCIGRRRARLHGTGTRAASMHANARHAPDIPARRAPCTARAAHCLHPSAARSALPRRADSLRAQGIRARTLPKPAQPRCPVSRSGHCMRSSTVRRSSGCLACHQEHTERRRPALQRDGPLRAAARRGAQPRGWGRGRKHTSRKRTEGGRCASRSGQRNRGQRDPHQAQHAAPVPALLEDRDSILLVVLRPSRRKQSNGWREAELRQTVRGWQPGRQSATCRGERDAAHEYRGQHGGRIQRRGPRCAADRAHCCSARK